jgi:hypothetical protein
MQTFNLVEAAEFVKMHPQTLEAKARAGEAPGAKMGKCWVFIDEDLAGWIRSRYSDGEKQCRSAKVREVVSGSANGRSAAKQLESLLAQRINSPRRNTKTTADYNRRQDCEFVQFTWRYHPRA